MCGRYVQTSTVQEVKAALGLAGAEKQGGNQNAHYNVAPRMYPWVALHDGRAGFHATQLIGAQWGLLPSWAKGPQGSTRPINARAETIFEQPMFRRIILRQRCLVAANGWYEWKTIAGKKIPYYFTLASEKPFFFGGVWDRWGPPPGLTETITTYAIITTAANELVAKVHDRMPLIVAPEDYDRWLDPRVTERAAIEGMLRPFPAELIAARRVSTTVNNAKNDGPGLIDPVPDDE